MFRLLPRDSLKATLGLSLRLFRVLKVQDCPTGLKGNKGQNEYLTRSFIGKIQVTFIKCVLYPDKVMFEKSPIKVGIRSLCWDHRGRNPNKRSQYLHPSVHQADRRNLRPARQAVQNYMWCCP